MKLYHGSTIDIAKADLALSKPNKDFGRASTSPTTVSRRWKWPSSVPSSRRPSL